MLSFKLSASVPAAIGAAPARPPWYAQPPPPKPGRENAHEVAGARKEGMSATEMRARTPESWYGDWADADGRTQTLGCVSAGVGQLGVPGGTLVLWS
jgi:hypothetical protein